LGGSPGANHRSTKRDQGGVLDARSA
jgi:hypothetical protein